MVLAGLVIAIGAVVDDAIVDVENIVRRLRQARARRQHAVDVAIVLDASVEVRSAIIYASLIKVFALRACVLPAGSVGAFFQPLVLPMSLAVLVSMLVALTVTPALCLIMLSRGTLARPESPMIPCAQALLPGCLSPLIVQARAGATRSPWSRSWRGLLVYPSLGQELLPNFKERDFLMHWLTKPGTSAPEMTRISVAACQGPAGPSPACATAARTSGRPSGATRPTASISARTGSVSTRRSTMTRR